MIIRCPQCQTGYNVSPEKLGDEGRTVRCSSCSHMWLAKAEEAAPLAPPTEPETESLTKTVEKEVKAEKQGRLRILLLLLCFVFLTGALFGLMRQLQIFQPTMQEDLQGRTLTETVEGLHIPAESIERMLTEGTPTTLTFKGKIVNNTNARVRVPKIIVSLHDEKGIELDRWPAYLQKVTLGPNEEAEWVCRFFDPALNRISEHRVRFVSEK